VLGPVIAAFIALLGIAIGAVYIATNEVKQNAEFRGRSDTRLGNLERDVLSIRLLLVAPNPRNAANQAQVKEVLNTAKTASIHLPTEVIERAGKSFLEAATDDPKAWDVALDFVNYRLGLTPWHNTVTVDLSENRYPWCFSRPPEDSGVSLSQDRTRATIYGPLIYQSCIMQIDDVAAAKFRNVTFGVIFRHCLIKYSGGQNLVAATYEQCNFEFDVSRTPSTAGRSLAENVLASPDTVRPIQI
jgi:hypothetical protein